MRHKILVNKKQNSALDSSVKRTIDIKSAVLGANDGIVSIAGLVIGVAGAQQPKLTIISTGLAGIVAGAMSMAVGEYVATCAERDQEKAMIAKEKKELRQHPQEELQDLAERYKKEGLDSISAEKIAKEFTKANAFAAHAEADLHLDPKNLVNPIIASIASAVAFISGALIPLLAIALPSIKYAVLSAVLAVILALSLTGYISAKFSGANKTKSTLRVVSGGILAMVVTYLIGELVHVAGA